MSKPAEKFTKGPWRVDMPDSVEAQAFDGSWKWVCQKVRGGNVDEREANLSLIASAPELYRLLANFAAGKYYAPESERFEDDVDKVLKVARGESS